MSVQGARAINAGRRTGLASSVQPSDQEAHILARESIPHECRLKNERRLHSPTPPLPPWDPTHQPLRIPTAILRWRSAPPNPRARIMSELNDEDLVDYEEDEALETKGQDEVKKGGTYSGIHASGFRDFLLKPELLRAVVDCGFEHPSEVQHECIPQAILGMDVVCQAKSGMGKTAVFVLSCLHQLEVKESTVSALVLCHTRELAYQINNEFTRFSRYLPDVKVSVFYGGTPVSEHKRILKNEPPHIIVGTPGRILQLVREKELPTKNIKHFILDECDKMLEQLGTPCLPSRPRAFAPVPRPFGRCPPPRFASEVSLRRPWRARAQTCARTCRTSSRQRRTRSR